MQKTIDETNYRRQKQMQYNQENNITPQPLNKKIEDALMSNISYVDKYGKENSRLAHVTETEMAYYAKIDYDKLIREKCKGMEKADKELDFIKAAEIRDERKALRDLKYFLSG